MKMKSEHERASFFSPRRTNQTLRATIEKLENDEKQLLSSPANALKLLAMEVLLDGKHEEGLTFINCALSLDSTIFNTEEYLKVNSADTFEAHEINDSLPNITVISTQPIEILRKNHWESYYKTLAARQMSKKNFFCAFRAIENALRIDSTVLDSGYKIHFPEKLHYVVYHEEQSDKINDFKHYLQSYITEPVFILHSSHRYILSRKDSDNLLNHDAFYQIVSREKMTYLEHSPILASVVFGLHHLLVWLLNTQEELTLNEQVRGDMLAFSAALGHVKIIEILLTRRIATVNQLGSEGMSALMAATLTSNTIAFKQLIEQGALVDLRSSDGATALMLAVSADLECVDMLIKNKASLDVIDDEGDTVLNTAVNHNHVEMIKRLLVGGASINHYSTTINNNENLCHSGKNSLLKYSITRLIQGSFSGKDEIIYHLLDTKSQITCECFACKQVESISKDISRLSQILLAMNFLLFNRNGMTALKSAAFQGHSESLRVLVSQGADINLKPRTYNDKTALMIAAECGHVSIVTELINSGASLEVQDRHGWTALFYAIWMRRGEVVRVLSASSESLDSCDNRGWTPIHLACWVGHIEIVQILISAHADINSKNNYGWTPLMIASYARQREVVKLLLLAHATVDISADYIPSCRKICCERIPLLSSLKLTSLLEAAVEPGQDEVFFKSHIQEAFACSCEVCRIINESLKNKFFDPNDFDRLCSLKEARCTLTALKIAAKFDQHEIVRMLIEGGATVDLQPDGFDQKTALMVAAESGATLAMNELINKGRALREAVDSQGWTALLKASWIGNLDVVKILLREKASVDAIDANGWTALHLATWQGHIHVVRALLEANAMPTWESTRGYMALMLAVYRGHYNIVIVLLNYPASINYVSQSGLTALMIAGRLHNKGMVELLLSKEANFTLVQREFLKKIDTEAVQLIDNSRKDLFLGGPDLIVRDLRDAHVYLIFLHPELAKARENILKKKKIECKFKKFKSRYDSLAAIQISRMTYDSLFHDYNQITALDFSENNIVTTLSDIIHGRFIQDLFESDDMLALVHEVGVEHEMAEPKEGTESESKCGIQ